MSDSRAMIIALREENETLKEELRQMRDDFRGNAISCPVRMTKQQEQVACLLRRHSPRILSRETLMANIDHHSATGLSLKLIDSRICHARRALSPLGIHIKTQWAVGYYIDKASAIAWDKALAQRAVAQ